jgi:hypothetical protein
VSESERYDVSESGCTTSMASKVTGFRDAVFLQRLQVLLIVQALTQGVAKGLEGVQWHIPNIVRDSSNMSPMSELQSLVFSHW